MPLLKDRSSPAQLRQKPARGRTGDPSSPSSQAANAHLCFPSHRVGGAVGAVFVAPLEPTEQTSLDWGAELTAPFPLAGKAQHLEARPKAARSCQQPQWSRLSAGAEAEQCCCGAQGNEGLAGSATSMALQYTEATGLGGISMLQGAQAWRSEGTHVLPRQPPTRTDPGTRSSF